MPVTMLFSARSCLFVGFVLGKPTDRSGQLVFGDFDPHRIEPHLGFEVLEGLPVLIAAAGAGGTGIEPLARGGGGGSDLLFPLLCLILFVEEVVEVVLADVVILVEIDSLLFEKVFQTAQQILGTANGFLGCRSALVLCLLFAHRYPNSCRASGKWSVDPSVESDTSSD